MTPLKTNDKIIIAGGIFVLIIAIIGIALYVQPTPEEPTTLPNNQGTDTYEVTWTTKTGSLSIPSEYISKKTPLEDTVKIPVGNIKSITFNLSWTDDKTLLKRFGLDTLTLEITTPDGEVIEDSATSMKKTAEGNILITVDLNKNKPSEDVITADSKSDAEYQLDHFNDKWRNQEFTVKITVNVGEFLGRFRPRDKGNSFTLDVDYEYYKGTVDPISDTGSMDETMQTGLESQTWRDTPYHAMSFIGRL